MDEVEWLMSAASWGGWKVWRVVDETPRMIEWRAPFPARRPSESSVKTVAQALDRAVAGYRNAKSHKAEALAAFQEGLRSCHGGKRSWPTWAMEPIETKRSVRGGEAIPWEDDALSAALSWSSEVRREGYRYPGPGVAERSAGVFSYLAQAFVSDEEAGIAPMFLDDYGIDKPIPLPCWARRPLELPVEPTPWQRARALHLRRPDLSWPDHAWYRPGRE